MLRKALIALALVLAATTSFAQRGRVIVPFPSPLPGTTATGFVSSVVVESNTIWLANGLVRIDASGATITDDHGAATTLASITPGSLIFAILKNGTSLQASSIVVTKLAQVTLTGPVQGVINSTLQLLGLNIAVDSQTSFGGGHNVHGLSDITVNDLVVVQANAGSVELLAVSILVLTPPPQPATLIHGTVKSIGPDSWVITDARRGDITVSVNAQTKIIGSPKAGDTVDVLANVDSAHNYVAISITLSPLPPPQGEMHLSGIVKSIGTTSWVIGPAAGLGPDFIVQVNAQTKIVNDPKVGDRVDVVVQMSREGFVAISITKV